MSGVTRAVRNNNPGNIRVSATQDWQGTMRPEDMSPEQAEEKDYVVFAAPSWGFRAIAKTLVSYKHHGFTSVRRIVTRWAPPVENNTAAYIEAVCDEAEFDADQFVDCQDAETAFKIIKAIARHEAGGWFWPDADLDEGLMRAGIN